MKNWGKMSQLEKSGQNAHIKTAEALADEFNVDEKTIRRDAKFAKAVDKIGDAILEKDPGETDRLGQNGGLFPGVVEGVSAPHIDRFSVSTPGIAIDPLYVSDGAIGALFLDLDAGPDRPLDQRAVSRSLSPIR